MNEALIAEERAAEFAAFIAEHPERAVHWWGIPPDGFCDEYATGDVVLDGTVGERAQVTCSECVEWVHA